MTDQLAGGWTLEKLRAKSPEERYTVWINARRNGSVEALELAKFIEASGLEYAPQGGISLSDPRVIEMRDVMSLPRGVGLALTPPRRVCLPWRASNR